MKFQDDQVLRHIDESQSIKELYSVALATGFWPDFPDYQISSLVLALANANVTSLNTIDEYIAGNEELVKKYFKLLFANRVDRHPWRLNAAFLCTLVLILLCSERFNEEWLTSNGWSPEVARAVCSVVSQLKVRV